MSNDDAVAAWLHANADVVNRFLQLRKKDYTAKHLLLWAHDQRIYTVPGTDVRLSRTKIRKALTHWQRVLPGEHHE